MEKLIREHGIEQMGESKDCVFAVLDSNETVVLKNCNTDCKIEDLWKTFSNKGYIISKEGFTERIIRFVNVKEIFKTKLVN